MSLLSHSSEGPASGPLFSNSGSALEASLISVRRPSRCALLSKDLPPLLLLIFCLLFGVSCSKLRFRFNREVSLRDHSLISISLSLYAKIYFFFWNVDIEKGIFSLSQLLACSEVMFIEYSSCGSLRGLSIKAMILKIYK